MYRVLYPLFDATFTADSFSCRSGKGTHKALRRFAAMARKVSKNNARTCWILKCDIRKFFANVNHAVLLAILRCRISDGRVIALLEEVIGSFSSEKPGVGLPLGNLTSQLFANVYLNEFDQFAKHGMKIHHYIRYADDFVVFSENRAYLESLSRILSSFLREKLRLEMHPDKIFIRTLASGMDFLGWVHFFDHRVLRKATKKRVFARLCGNSNPAMVNSYLGLLGHGNAYRLRQKVFTIISN